MGSESDFDWYVYTLKINGFVTNGVIVRLSLILQQTITYIELLILKYEEKGVELVEIRSTSFFCYIIIKCIKVEIDYWKNSSKITNKCVMYVENVEKHNRFCIKVHF